jgi:type II restriction/modification system DNA methylase subunit YeeA
MTPQEFIAKWQRSNLSERSACQQHFCDLCDLLEQPKPAQADPDGEWYTFERGVTKTEGGRGWADVWKRGHFGWEYKGKHKDLAEAYSQLLLYREALENPPLLVVCDLDRFQVHTNFTGTAKRIYAFNLGELSQPVNLDVLRRVFTDPESLRPDITTRKITEEAAKRFGELADGIRARDVPAQNAAHFLMKLMFCMFGEDIGLLPKNLFTSLIEKAKENSAILTRRLESLFTAMANGGDFGADTILRFNGGLYDDAEIIPLTSREVNVLADLAAYDWSFVEPSIFGTLFERTLDPGKRSQIGAHYTSREDILTLLEPVVMAPLRREWEEVKCRCEGTLWPAVKEAAQERKGQRHISAKASKERRRFDRQIQDFSERLAHVTVLDPACGSGNFLYVAINLLLDLEKEVIAYAAAHGLTLLPHVRPTQLCGLEINPYAQQLAQVVIWIGYLQWMHHNGFKMPSDPVLEPIEAIYCQDAILDLSDASHPKEPDWPEAEFIVSNPPFLGGKLLRTNLGDEYVDAMFCVWDDRVPREADLCCYWFERARRQIERKKCSRAGLLATQGIRGGANRRVLTQIKETGDIFFAESDRDWILDGANVHVSMVGFDSGADRSRILDGKAVGRINANLRASAADTTRARPICENVGVSFMGDTKGGSFDISDALAIELLHIPNPHGRPNSDVVVPWINGQDVTGPRRQMWIIDFGTTLGVADAAKYDAPFAHVEKNVKPGRSANKRESYRERWWIHVEPRPALREHLATLSRFIVTTRVSKYRIFDWFERPTLPDSATFAFARADDCFFGLLHGRVHEVWARVQGTQVREVESGFRYTPSSCFETFPLPECVRKAGCDGFNAAIAAAAKELDELRNGWLNPPEWTKTEVLEFPGSVDGPWARYVDPATVRPISTTGRPHPSPLPTNLRSVPGEGTVGIGTVRWPRIVPKDADCAESLKKRTLTNLYNQRPTWLAQAHTKLDAAVFAAYGWEADISDEEILKRLLALNLERAKS